jgi:hypothetical protein
MLTRESPELLRVNGRQFEVCLRPRAGGRPVTKLERHVGTGFLATWGHDAVIVTAAHVARAMDAEAHVSFAGPDGARLCRRLGDLVARPVRWAGSGRADVAAVRLRTLPATLRGRCLSADLLRGRRPAPSCGLDLLVMGFPFGLYSETRFVPLVKHSHAASGILRLRGEEMGGPADFFLLDQPTAGGFSGGPVFVAAQVEVSGPGQVANVAPACVGLVSQTISDEKGAQFAAVAPISAVRRALVHARRRTPGRERPAV